MDINFAIFFIHNNDVCNILLYPKLYYFFKRQAAPPIILKLWHYTKHHFNEFFAVCLPKLQCVALEEVHTLPAPTAVVIIGFGSLPSEKYCANSSVASSSIICMELQQNSKSGGTPQHHLSRQLSRLVGAVYQ